MEVTSFSRVSNSGIFANITSKDWTTLGAQAVNNKNVLLRRGFDRFKTEKELRWRVLSVNFSQKWVEGILGVGEEIEVVANYVDEDGKIRGPGGGDVMATSDGKLEALKGMMKELEMNGMEKVVYVGDSGTDLECLVEDGVIGVVMSEDGESGLLKTLGRIGFKVSHIGDYDEGLDGLYWTRDFDELLDSRLFR